MTVSSTTTQVSYTGDASTTNFSVTFPFLGTGSSAELTVVERTIATGAEVTKSYTTDYTVTGGEGSTGTVIAVSAPAATVEWHIRRNTTTTQLTDYQTNDPFPADTHELALDRLAMSGQERDGDIAQAFKYADTYTGGGSTTVPDPTANAYLKWNAAGNALENSTSSAAQYLGGDGTVSLPFYSFSADPDTGIYRIGTNNLGIAANGTKIVDIDTSGLNGTIGATTAAAGTFTTLTGTTIDGTIGSVTPAAGTFTTMTGTDLTLSGNLTVNGTTTTVSTTNTVLSDNLIELNNGAASNANDSGIVIERGSTGDNVFIGWDESADQVAFGTTTSTGSATGNITYSVADVNMGTLNATGGVISGTWTNSATFTNMKLATGATVTGIADEDDMSSDSATLIATQQSIKAYVDTAIQAPGIQMTWETATTDTDQGAGKVWANNATLSSATVLYFDDVENNSVSINSFIDSLDDPTATDSAIIYIQEAGASPAGVVFKVSGAVTSASTYSKVAVTHVATYGTLSDGDTIGVTFAFSGNNGAGDLLAANNLSDVADAATALNNLGGADIGLVIALGG